MCSPCNQSRKTCIFGPPNPRKPAPHSLQAKIFRLESNRLKLSPCKPKLLAHKIHCARHVPNLVPFVKSYLPVYPVDREVGCDTPKVGVVSQLDSLEGYLPVVPREILEGMLAHWDGKSDPSLELSNHL